MNQVHSGGGEEMLSPNENRATRRAFLCFLGVSAVLLLGRRLMSYLGTRTVLNLQLPFSPIDNLLLELADNGTQRCHLVSTTSVHIFGIPAPQGGSEITLSTGVLYEFLLVAFDANGSRRCQGGDFFETDLTGPQWKSRPPLVDLGKGSYKLELYVEDAAPGSYLFNVTHLFTNFHGLDRYPDPWAILKEVVNLKINFLGHQRAQTCLPTCLEDKFKLQKWKGRWTRPKSNESCIRPNLHSRYRCLDDDESCDSPWCEGPLGRLDSNGWVYSAHCSFHLWSVDETWDCLKGKRLFFWGDSNHQDTIRDLVNLVLDLDHSAVRRFLNETFVDKSDPSRSFQVMEVFNGHYNQDKNNMGLHSLENAEYRDRVSRLFAEDGYPSVLIMNSGLHDGAGYLNPLDYVAGARNASKFWGELTRSMPSRSSVIFRRTVTPAGAARRLVANPFKMEVYSDILTKELLQEIENLQVVPTT